MRGKKDWLKRLVEVTSFTANDTGPKNVAKEPNCAARRTEHSVEIRDPGVAQQILGRRIERKHPEVDSPEVMLSSLRINARVLED